MASTASWTNQPMAAVGRLPADTIKTLLSHEGREGIFSLSPSNLLTSVVPLACPPTKVTHRPVCPRKLCRTQLQRLASLGTPPKPSALLNGRRSCILQGCSLLAPRPSKAARMTGARQSVVLSRTCLSPSWTLSTMTSRSGSAKTSRTQCFMRRLAGSSTCRRLRL